MTRRMMDAVLVEVSGPLSWSYYWPTAPIEYTLNRAARALKRLTIQDAPYGVYRITVNGSSREVVRSAAERAA